MKTVKNKMTTIPLKDSQTGKILNTLDYAYLVIMCINFNSKGISISEMRDYIKIIDVCKSKKLKFEDAEFEILKKKVKEMRWAFTHKDLIKFNDDIENLKD